MKKIGILLSGTLVVATLAAGTFFLMNANPTQTVDLKTDVVNTKSVSVGVPVATDVEPIRLGEPIVFKNKNSLPLLTLRYEELSTDAKGLKTDPTKVALRAEPLMAVILDSAATSSHLTAFHQLNVNEDGTANAVVHLMLNHPDWAKVVEDEYRWRHRSEIKTKRNSIPSYDAQAEVVDVTQIICGLVDPTDSQQNPRCFAISQPIPTRRNAGRAEFGFRFSSFQWAEIEAAAREGRLRFAIAYAFPGRQIGMVTTTQAISVNAKAFIESKLTQEQRDGIAPIRQTEAQELLRQVEGQVRRQTVATDAAMLQMTSPNLQIALEIFGPGVWLDPEQWGKKYPSIPWPDPDLELTKAGSQKTGSGVKTSGNSSSEREKHGFEVGPLNVNRENDRHRYSAEEEARGEHVAFDEQKRRNVYKHIKVYQFNKGGQDRSLVQVDSVAVGRGAWNNFLTVDPFHPDWNDRLVDAEIQRMMKERKYLLATQATKERLLDRRTKLEDEINSLLSRQDKLTRQGCELDAILNDAQAKHLEAHGTTSSREGRRDGRNDVLSNMEVTGDPDKNPKIGKKQGFSGSAYTLVTGNTREYLSAEQPKLDLDNIKLAEARTLAKCQLLTKQHRENAVERIETLDKLVEVQEQLRQTIIELDAVQEALIRAAESR